ncbi:LLM class flavin-dependent oxidoreductase [Nocardia sp. NPDC019395]|uniref:LLM class flavin-dependent oxidoreductase n=1 Tax=Nocardia sp. NPDC019395 TaxID=3154686 RepID=UPI0034045A7C
MATQTEFWTNFTATDPRQAPAQAAKFEADGWDGAVMVDSQCMFPEAWVYLTLCAQATSRIKLATGVTNPITRHPSVTAAAVASLQLVSGGRATLGIGRGDSALAYVGASPMRIAEFEHYLEVLQTYLRGEEVDMDAASAMLVNAQAGFDNLAIGSAPTGSSLKWLGNFDMPKVPVEAFATGPKAIAAAARSSEMVMLAMSAEVNRVAWGVDLARSAAAAAGRQIGVGCTLIVVPHENVQVARDLARAQIASQARFSVMNNKVIGPATDAQAATLRKIAAVYDMNRHAQTGKGVPVGRVGAAQAQAVDDDFADQFGVVGTVDTCVDRLTELAALGVDRMSLWLPYVKDPEAEHAYDLLMNEVLPRVRASQQADAPGVPVP